MRAAWRTRSAFRITSWMKADNFERAGHRLFHRGIPQRPHAEPVRDVQREGEVRQSLGEGEGGRRGLHRHRALRHRRASRRSRGAAPRAAIRARISRISSSACGRRSSSARSSRSARWRRPEIRAIARQLGLKTADKVDSQEICFVPGNDYKAFLKSHLGEGEFHPGGIYDKAGNRVAEHEGIEMFTIGQRKGLPGGSPRPMYVIDIDPGDEPRDRRRGRGFDHRGIRDRPRALASATPTRAVRGHGENPLRPSRRGGDGLSRRKRHRARPPAHAAARRHARPGRRLLSRRRSARRRLDRPPASRSCPRHA